MTIEWTSGAHNAPLPPLVPGLPLVGNALSLAGDSRPFLLETYRRYGPIVRVRAMNQTMILMAGPEANQFFSQAGNEHLRSRELWEGFAAEMEADNLINAIDGETHAWQRKMMKAGFSRGTILAQLPAMTAIARAMAATLRPGQLMPVLPFMQQLVTEQLGLLLTSHSPSLYITDIRRMVRTNLNVLVVRQWPRLLLALPSHRRSKARVKELAQDVIAAHRADGAAPDFVIDLIAAHDANPQRFTEHDLLVAVIGPYIAGLDTVANSCTFMLYALLSHPDILARVQTELESVLGDETISAEHLKQLPALHGAAMETLRLYPVAPVMQRTTTKPFVFAGYQVDADQTVLIATSVAHGLAQLFPQPERFDIDRYHEPRNEHRQRGAFAPFGLGAHTCLGAGLAEVQIAVIMAELLRTVNFALEPRQHPKIRTDPTLSLGRSFCVRITAQRKAGSHIGAAVPASRDSIGADI